MKRIALLILSFTYLSLNLGLAISKHYCGNFLKEVKLVHQNHDEHEHEHDCHNGCMMHTCCSDEEIALEIDDSQKLPETTTVVFFTGFANLPPTTLHYLKKLVEPQTTTSPYTVVKVLPPLKEPLYIQHQSLTYYG